MLEFIRLTDQDGNSRLVSLSQIIFIDYYTGGGSSIRLRENIKIQVKESVDQIYMMIENWHQ